MLIKLWRFSSLTRCKLLIGLPWLNGKKSRRFGLIPGLWRSSGEGNGNPLQHSWPGKSHGQRSLGSYGPWGCKRVGHDLATKQQQQQKLLIPSWVISDRILHSCMSHNFLNSLDLWSKFYLGLPASSPEPSTIRNILHLACWKVSFFF